LEGGYPKLRDLRFQLNAQRKQREKEGIRRRYEEKKAFIKRKKLER